MARLTDEEKKERNRLKQAKWRKQHPEKNLEKVVQYNEDNPEKHRAMYLVQDYKRNDKEHNRGECTLTAKWIIDNIFTKHCVHCGESDWRKLGCNRINNDLPHIPDNVEPCCGDCNRKIH